MGGSDKVAAELAELAEVDVVYTFALDDDCVEALGIRAPVITWRFGRWAGRSRRFTMLLVIMPLVWWALDLSAADRVLTSSHSCVNAIRTPRARRLSYCHTPMRYAWAWQLEADRLPAVLRPLFPAGAAILRLLDRRWSRRVDQYLANSSFVADRIRAAYGVEALVVAPPVDVDRFELPATPTTDDAPFVAAGRWVAYKRFDLAIAAAQAAGVELVVAGGGPAAAKLRAAAGARITFVEDPTDTELARLLAGARAVVMCGIEDFGILPVEAQACGTPVIARDEGGALDYVVDHVTGHRVTGDSVSVWAAALAHFDRSAYDPAVIRQHAQRFSRAQFRARMGDVLDAAFGSSPEISSAEAGDMAT